MKENRSLTVIALIVAILALSMGFAAFSNTITIKSNAVVTPDNTTMRVVFSQSSNSEVTGGEHAVLPDDDTYGDPGTIDNSETGDSVLKALHAKFTAPGQSVTYNTNLYIYNAGNYQAQIKSIVFNNAPGSSTYKKCTAGTGSTDELVQSACNGITISVKVGTKTATPLDPTLNNQIIGIHESLPVEVTISYGGEIYSDGPFEVAFGDIVVTSSSSVN